MIFGEVEVEDEYNPMFPNDYDKCLAKKEAEKRLKEKEKLQQEAADLAKEKANEAAMR